MVRSYAIGKLNGNLLGGKKKGSAIAGPRPLSSRIFWNRRLAMPAPIATLNSENAQRSRSLMRALSKLSPQKRLDCVMSLFVVLNKKRNGYV